MFIGALGLLSGTMTRLSTVLALLAFHIQELRLPELCDGGDNILRLVLIYMILLLPPEAKPARGKLSVWVHNLAVVAIASQLIVVYLTSGFMKASGQRWHHGTALYLVSQVDWFSLPGTRAFFRNPIVTTFASYSTLAYQVWFPVAIFSPLRRVWLLAGMMFHLGIAVTMGLITFSTMMISLELFLLTDDEYRSLKETAGALLQRLRLREPRWVMFFDGFCPLCTRTRNIVQRLDLRRGVRTSSFRHERTYAAFGIDTASLEQRMYVVDLRTGKITSAFAAVRTLARALFWLWPLRPLLWAIDAFQLGDRAYQAIASRRLIIADSRSCIAEECHIPLTGERSS
jgi:predicted DCC family thiol-disulfide oxidoreductase YuxK